MSAKAWTALFRVEDDGVEVLVAVGSFNSIEQANRFGQQHNEPDKDVVYSGPTKLLTPRQFERSTL